MNSVHHTPIVFKAQEPAIFDYDAMRKITEKNPETYSRRILTASWPKGICIDRETSNGAVRRLSYENRNSEHALYEISHGYKPETYNYAANTFSRAEYPDFRTMIRSDGRGNYYFNDTFGRKRAKKFENFPEMLAFFRKYKSKQEKGPSAFKRILLYFMDKNFEDVKINSTDKNVKEKLVKIAQKRMNSKSFAWGVPALINIIAMFAGGGWVNCVSSIMFSAFTCRHAIYDRIQLIKSPLYKEYKASLPESTGLLKKAAKLLRK